MYTINWKCLYCNFYHSHVQIDSSWFIESWNFNPSITDVKCKKCSELHTIKTYISDKTIKTKVIFPYKPGIFLNMGIDKFLHNYVPVIHTIKKINEKYNHDIYGISSNQAFHNWCEHDALHFISGNPFTDEGERNVAFIEKKFNCGWVKYNGYIKYATECETDYINADVIAAFTNIFKNIISSEI